MELNEMNLTEEQLTMVQKYVQSETDKVRTKYSQDLKTANEDVDKRKLIDEVAGMMKSAGADDELIRTAIAKMEKLGYDGEELSIMFTDDTLMQELNKSYRNIDSSTDVLSFENGEEYNDEDGNKWLNAGDIAISLDMLPVNAAYFNCSENEELKRLLVHGLLHLNGMDHGDEHIEKNQLPVCEMLVTQENLLSELKDEIIIGNE